MPRNFDIIIYHKNCPDGIGGLWTANHYKKGAVHYPMFSGEVPHLDDIKNKSILFVDVCPKPEFIIKNIKNVCHITILDHHKSSKKMLEDILKYEYAKLEIIFDTKRSGAQITWDFFFPDCPRPFFIDYIGDKDLWKWKLPFSKEINYALTDFLELDKLNVLYQEEEKSFQKLLKLGSTFDKKLLC